jgi:putative MATE family efflux protein
MSQTDLTQGGIVKPLIRYSIPLILSSVLQAMYGIVDTIVAGQFIGSAALSGLTNANTVITMVTQILFGLTQGGSMLVGQYFGAKDTKNTHEATVTLFTWGMAAGILASALLFLASRPILQLLGAPALTEAHIYLRTCAVGFFFVAGYNACAAALRAVGNSKAPLVCIAATAVVNIVLDIFFVAGLGMGVFGAGLATVISQAISFLVACYYLLKAPDVFGLRLNHLYIRRDKLRAEWKLGFPCAVQMSVAALSWLSVTFLINTYGVSVSAGNGVSNKIKEFCQLIINTMSTAAASMVAQNIGAGQFDRARKTMYSAMKLTVAMALVIILFVELLAPQLAGIFTSDQDTLNAAVRNLRFEIIGQVFYASFLVYHSLMMGSGDTWFVFCSSFINCILMRTLLGILFNHLWGLDGLYIACMIAPFSSVPFGLWYERSNRWRKKLI